MTRLVRLLGIGVAVTCSLASETPAQSRDTTAVRGPTDGQVLFFLQSMPAASSKIVGPIINALLSDTTSHMRMLERPRATNADSARAADIVRTMRRSLAQYTDVAAAERDGYALFLPWLEDQVVYHYNHLGNAGASGRTFDVSKPTSLLYRKDESGRKVLVGAMYTAPATATPEQLDQRLPVGVAFWHQHVNFCAMRPTLALETVQQGDSATLARWLAIETPEACAAAGGLFLPRLFGWMAHVNAFDGDDAGTIWGTEGKDHMHRHHSH